MEGQIQSILESATRSMQEAEQRIRPDLATTRVLHSLVTVLSQRFLTVDQQDRIEELLNRNERCVQGKNKRTSIMLFDESGVRPRLNHVNGRLTMISRSLEHPNQKRVRALVEVACLLEDLSAAYLQEGQQAIMQQIIEVLNHL